MNEIAIVILSCDKYKITWKPCVDYFTKAWPNCPYKVYLLNNKLRSEDDRVTDLLVGEDISWSDSLIRGLEKLSEKRVFFIYDDSFLTYLDVAAFENLFKVAVEQDFVSLTLRKNPFDRGFFYNDDVIKLHQTTRYRNALFMNLIKRDVLLSLLHPGENAWQFEKEGNSRNSKYDFYSINGKKTIVKYMHGIVKGKWLPKTKLKLMKAGYEVNDKSIGVFTRNEVLKMDIYAALFFRINKLYHFSRMFNVASKC